MDKDTRHALGNGSEDEMFGENKLSEPYPYDFYGRKLPPEKDFAGTPNPANKDRRPIAQMHPTVGEGSLKEGLAFCYRMGDPDDT